MARYIDADKAKHEFNIGFGGVSHAVIANQIIDSIPTADVVEVKHGEWISKTFKVTGRKFITCSVCNSPIDSTYTHIDENEFDYCPYCGAKMDGGK